MTPCSGHGIWKAADPTALGRRFAHCSPTRQPAYLGTSFIETYLYDVDEGHSATARVAAEFDGWAPELTALITDGDIPPIPRILYVLPTGHRWDRVPGVTLLGDAAHLMPPSGDGANLAMFDRAELGKALAAHPDDIEAALTVYEEAMFARSGSTAANAHEVLDLCLGDRAPYGFIDFFTGAPSE